MWFKRQLHRAVIMMHKEVTHMIITVKGGGWNGTIYEQNFYVPLKLRLF